MAPVLTPLASRIVDQIPMLLERLREYEAQEKALDVRCQELKDELYSRKRGITEVNSMQSGVHTRDIDEAKENVWLHVQDGEKDIGTPLIKPRINAKIRDVRGSYTHRQGSPGLLLDTLAVDPQRVAIGPSTKPVSLVRNKRKGGHSPDEELDRMITMKKAKLESKT